MYQVVTEWTPVHHLSTLGTSHLLLLPTGLELLIDGSVQGHLPELRDRVPGGK